MSLCLNAFCISKLSAISNSVTNVSSKQRIGGDGGLRWIIALSFGLKSDVCLFFERWIITVVAFRTPLPIPFWMNEQSSSLPRVRHKPMQPSNQLPSDSLSPSSQCWDSADFSLPMVPMKETAGKDPESCSPESTDLASLDCCRSVLRTAYSMFARL